MVSDYCQGLQVVAFTPCASLQLLYCGMDVVSDSSDTCRHNPHTVVADFILYFSWLAELMGTECELENPVAELGLEKAGASIHLTTHLPNKGAQWVTHLLVKCIV